MRDDGDPASPVDPKLLEILVCPLTKGPLRYDRERQELISEQAGPRLSDPRRHPDHAGRRGAPARRGRRDPGRGARAPGRGPSAGMTSAPEPTPGRPRSASTSAEKRLESPSTTASASSCRPSCCASRARRPRSRATGRPEEDRRRPPPCRHHGARAGRQLRDAHHLRRPARHRHLLLELSVPPGQGPGTSSGRPISRRCSSAACRAIPELSGPTPPPGASDTNEMTAECAAGHGEAVRAGRAAPSSEALRGGAPGPRFLAFREVSRAQASATRRGDEPRKTR